MVTEAREIEAPPIPPSQAPVSIKIIAGILIVAALYLAREFFVPLALAATFHALCRPVVRGLERLMVPTVVGATIVVLGALGLVAAAGWGLSGPANDFVERAPQSLRSAREKLSRLGRPIARITDASKPQGSSQGQAESKSPAPIPVPSGAGGGSIYIRVLGGATALVSETVEIVLLLLLMLAAGDVFLRKLVKVLPSFNDKRTAAELVHNTEGIVARYLLATALINIGQGIAVGLTMWWIGIPDPLIWGLLTFALEFIPYLGGATMVGLLLITGFTSFDSVGHALLAPAIYLVITTIQNNAVSPYVYGGRLKLSPLAVLVFALFWWFLWGVPGVFLSVPIAATMKALGDQIPRLAAVGEFLGE